MKRLEWGKKRANEKDSIHAKCSDFLLEKSKATQRTFWFQESCRASVLHHHFYLCRAIKNEILPDEVAPACNPSYSRGTDQEGHGLKPAWENSSRESISKVPKI
jgi:hypothetical protein